MPGDPEYIVNGGTTVSGGRTVLSAMAQQSFRTLRRPWQNTTRRKKIEKKLKKLQEFRRF